MPVCGEKIFETRKHSSNMRAAKLPCAHALLANRCQHQVSSQVNKFEQVSSFGQQMSPAGVPYNEILVVGQGMLLYGLFQCIMGNYTMGYVLEQ